MKKITLLFIFAFVLSSCGFAPAESPKATGDAPIESLPKNVSYLADKDFDTDEPLPGFEADPAFILPGSPLCETDEAYYYIFADAATSQFYIYYYDKARFCLIRRCYKSINNIGIIIVFGCSFKSFFQNASYYVNHTEYFTITIFPIYCAFLKNILTFVLYIVFV